jgi:hypothetical protein
MLNSNLQTEALCLLGVIDLARQPVPVCCMRSQPINGFNRTSLYSLGEPAAWRAANSTKMRPWSSRVVVLDSILLSAVLVDSTYHTGEHFMLKNFTMVNVSLPPERVR